MKKVFRELKSILELFKNEHSYHIASYKECNLGKSDYILKRHRR